MTAVHLTVWDDTGGAGPPVLFVHNIFTWGTDEAYGFAAQRPLADRCRLLVMDRRGYGASPDTDRSDFDVDAADIIGVLEAQAGGAHLVGHGNGGLAALLAAAQRPELVRSLALIQPAAFDVAKTHPAVRAMFERVRASSGAEAPELTPEQFLRAATEGIGLPAPAPTPHRLRAVATSMAERPVWEATVPVPPLASATWPKLVIRGDWENAPELYREYAGEPLRACAHALADAIGARLLTVPGYYPHIEEPLAVNAALRELWG
ncbi:alpha/beta fold hydrolase [Amycolatopsis sp. CA-230715]|uniref:alpha/beta fold hydrolase n=1 Tax=Amycolatopsis sp. CA-230715 TaxID=2745196 RepID=UPI001C0240BF|nr:alpha/beta hydrolase [Amycolatopsis sp. CA-230715]QWF84928.1 hypothetical protein HUW46_08380 [Amycolatopsis sp. CA-230715]